MVFRQPFEVRRMGTFFANLWEFVVKTHNFKVKSHFGQVGVQLDNALAEAVHVLRQQLVRVGNSIVQIGHFVEGEPVQILRVKVVGQPLAEAQFQLAKTQLNGKLL